MSSSSATENMAPENGTALRTFRAAVGFFSKCEMQPNSAALTTGEDLLNAELGARRGVVRGRNIAKWRAIGGDRSFRRERGRAGERCPARAAACRNTGGHDAVERCACDERERENDGNDDRANREDVG